MHGLASGLRLLTPLSDSYRAHLRFRFLRLFTPLVFPLLRGLRRKFCDLPSLAVDQAAGHIVEMDGLPATPGRCTAFLRFLL